MSAPLQVRGLTRRFRGATSPVIEALDLDVPRTGCVTLLGPSGTGKSTVLRLVAGLDSPDAGEIRIDGKSMAGVPTERRRTVLVFQRPRLFPHLDVLGNIAFPLTVAGTPNRQARREAAAFLDLVKLGHLARRRPAALSGGEEQRVALARALAARPAVLLLDEPFSALDPSVRGEMHTLLQELRAAVEPTILLVTHDRHEAATLADSVAVLLQGRLAQHDVAAALFSRPASLAVHRFLGGSNAVAGTVIRGRHVSPLGTLALPAPGAPLPSAGPGVLVIRQEALRLVAADSTERDVAGTVTAVHQLGPRSIVEVTCSGEVLTAEVGAWDAPRRGDVVGLDLPVSQRHVVAADARPSDAASPSGDGPARNQDSVATRTTSAEAKRSPTSTPARR